MGLPLTRQQRQVALLCSVLAVSPMLQGAGLMRASRELAEAAVHAGQDLSQAVAERWARAFGNNDVGGVVPTEVAKSVTQEALKDAAAAAPTQAAGIRAASTGAALAGSSRAKAAPTRGQLTIDTSPADATVRIMNIRPKYRDGISLSPGRYDVMVSADGYRTKRFPLIVKSGSVAVDVELARRSGFSCANSQYYDGGDSISNHGYQVRTETLLENTTLYEVYSSLAQSLQQEANYLFNVTTDISENYAYLSAWQSTNLSPSDIARNHDSDIGRSRSLQNHYGLEKVDKDTVRLIHAARIPVGALTSDQWLREGHCLELEKL